MAAPGAPCVGRPEGLVRPYLRVLFIMLLSFIVVLVGTVAVVDTQRSLARNDGLWFMVFALLAIATVIASRLFRSR